MLYELDLIILFISFTFVLEGGTAELLTGGMAIVVNPVRLEVGSNMAGGGARSAAKIAQS